MRITKCDICKKTIKRGTESTSLGYSSVNSFASFEFCSECSKPLIKILEDKKLIKAENKKDGRKK